MTLRLAVHAALPAAIVATLTSLTVTILLYALNGYDLGSGWSQRLLLRVSDTGALGGAPSKVRASVPDAPKAWALVDIGPSICAPPPPGKAGRCWPDRQHTDLAAVAPTIRWAARVSPRLIVVDIAAVTNAEEAGKLDRALADIRVPVLMALWADTSFLSDPEPVVPPYPVFADQKGRKVRYFYPMIRKPDPMSRGLLPMVRLAGSGGISPTLAYAAAQEIGMPGRCAISLAGAACLDDWAKTERVFSFAPTAPADSPAWQETWRTVSPTLTFLYLVAPLSENDAAPTHDLAGGVILIGNTRTTVGDNYPTSVGTVSGAEIQLNDIRQFLVADPTPRQGLFGALINDVPFTLLGLLITIGVQTVAIMHPVSRKTLRLSYKARKAARMVLIMLAISLCSTIVFGLWLILMPSSGAPPDFMTPFWGILIGNLLESTARVSARIEEHLKLRIPRTRKPA